MPRRRYRRVSDEDRDRIITRYEAGEAFLDTAAELRTPRSTAYEIIRKFVETGEIRGRHGGGRPPVLGDEAKDFLVMLVEATPTITIRELNHTLRALDGELITLKQVHNVSANRNSEDVKAARIAFAQYMYEDGIHQHRVYLDETGYNLYTCRTYGRAPQGQRVNRIVAGQRGSNLTLIAAISNLVGLFYYEIHVTSVTKEVFKNFMTSLDSVLGPEAALILMDNAPWHAGIEQEFEDRVIKKLPPHSPFLNPIENCFSVLKATVKRQLNNIADRCDARAARRHGVTCSMYRERLLQ
ncbi:putative DDE superfamily endonuclease domain-containing protein 63, partial [Homarus americanus]